MDFTDLSTSQQKILEDLENEDSIISDVVAKLTLLSLLEVMNPEDKKKLVKAYGTSEREFLKLLKRFSRKYEYLIKEKVITKLT